MQISVGADLRVGSRIVCTAHRGPTRRVAPTVHSIENSSKMIETRVSSISFKTDLHGVCVLAVDGEFHVHFAAPSQGSRQTKVELIQPDQAANLAGIFGF